MVLFTGHTITPDSALGGIQLEKSLRFDRPNATHLTKTPSSAGNRDTFTIALWYKRANSDNQHALFYAGSSVGTNNNNVSNLSIYADGTLEFGTEVGQVVKHQLTTNRLFRDPSAWYHIVLAVDTTQGSSSNRIKLYINGVQETSFSTSTYGDQNQDTWFNSTEIHVIGFTSSGRCPQGYMAELYWIDGQAYDASYFGFTDAQTGQWRPKKATGLTYGTNGYHLDFRDNSSTSALGRDYSGNGNHWTVNNFSVSAGSGNDSLIDTPTNNFCILNGVNQDSNTTLTEGNLKAAGSTSTNYSFFTRGTVAKSSGKWYYEVEYTSNAGGHNSHLPAIGWARTSLRATDNPTVGGALVYRPAASDYIDLDGNDTSNDKPATSTGNVIQVAIDLDSGQIWFGNGGTYFESGNPSAGTNPNITFTGGAEELSPFVRSLSSTFIFNFGQRAFSYTPPTGYRSLTSKNLATVNAAGVVRPQRHFGIVTWSGNDSSQTIDGLEFTPDFVWIKAIRSGENHFLTDIIRGAGHRLQSNTTNAESDRSSEVTAFVRGGFTIAGTHNEINGGGVNMVAWCWKAGGAGVSNSDGNITSTVSANQEAGFSIVTYTGNGNSPQTVGHGLGKAPAIVMVKDRDNSMDWVVKHQDLSSNKILYLQQNAAEDTGTGGNNGIVDNLTSATTTTVTLTNNGSGNMNMVNKSSTDYVMYCWAEIPGYSKIGFYTGNGSTDGTYVHLGFRPAFILWKPSTQASTDWVLMDSTRDTFNPLDTYLLANSSGPGGTLVIMDFLSNGFKLRQVSGNNESGQTIIFMAFAERPSGTTFGLDANAR